MDGVNELYKSGGVLEKWNQMVELADPDYGKRLYSILKEGVITPSRKNFVFLSVSSNGGSREISLARELDKDGGGGKLESKPTIIASDISDVAFQSIPNFANVNFVRLRADAYNLPVEKRSIDVIFDRMGAIWYKVHNGLERATRINGKLPEWEVEEIVEDVKKTLLQYKEKLKDGGTIILDDPDRKSTDPISTVQYLKKIIPDINNYLSDLGLAGQNVGSSEDRLLVIGPVSRSLRF